MNSIRPTMANRNAIRKILSPRLLVSLSGIAPIRVLLRPSNEATDNPSKLAHYIFRDGG